MKCKLEAKTLKEVLNVAKSIYDFAKEDSDVARCISVLVDDEDVYIEYGSSGVYIKKKVEADALRPGEANIDIELLKKATLAGTLTLDQKSDMVVITTAKTTYKFRMAQSESNPIHAFRPPPTKSTPTYAIVPSDLLSAMVKSITYKPGVQATGFVQIEVAKKKGLRVSGFDGYSYAISQRSGSGIGVKKSGIFPITPGVLSGALSLITSDKIHIKGTKGSTDRSPFIRFAAKGFDFCHPVVYEEAADGLDESLKSVASETKRAVFEIGKKQFFSGVKEVNIFGDQTNPATIELRVTPKLVKVFSEEEGKSTGHAETRLETEEIKAKKKVVMPIMANYLHEFVRIFPNTLKMKVTLHKSVLKFEGEGLDEGYLVYVVSSNEADE